MRHKRAAVKPPHRSRIIELQGHLAENYAAFAIPEISMSQSADPSGGTTVTDIGQASASARPRQCPGDCFTLKFLSASLLANLASPWSVIFAVMIAEREPVVSTLGRHPSGASRRIRSRRAMGL